MPSDKIYKFQNAEIGVMSEIMLPKKIQYQGFLFNSLLEGIETFSFVSHYNKYKESIKSLLENYPSLTTISEKELKYFDTQFNDVFKGYSMYEVDGVFKFESDKYKQSFIEERTQIVRVYYIPEYKKIQNLINNTINKGTNKIKLQTIINFADLFFSISKVTSYDNSNILNRIRPLLDSTSELQALGFTDHTAEKIKEQLKFLFEYFQGWVDAVAFFTFGYIMWKITTKLKEMDKNDKVGYLEEQIWVTSQWGVLINKTILQNPNKKK